jgi:hypothetical protein
MLTIFVWNFLQLIQQIWNQCQTSMFFIPILNLLGIIFVVIFTLVANFEAKPQAKRHQKIFFQHESH